MWRAARSARGRLALAGLAVAALGLLLIWLDGDAGYYLHLARAQAHILWDQRPVSEVLADSTTAPQVRARLVFVGDVRRFAADSLGLPAAGQFTRFHDTGGEPVAWNVSACPPDRFEAYRWSFPFVGALPYKGFFARQRAVDERDRLRALGYDAIARGVSAYSTLGWLPDPVLSTMLERSDDSLADLILHELTHAAVYAENQTDYNESVATFVGQQGALRFLASRRDADAETVAQARAERQLAARFNDFLRQATDRLDSLYHLGHPRAQVLREREALFAAAKQEYRQRRDELGAGRYDGFLDWEVNNARLLSYRRYHRDLDRFAAVLARQHGDLAAALRVFVTCGDAPDPWSCLDAPAADD